MAIIRGFASLCLGAGIDGKTPFQVNPGNRTNIPTICAGSILISTIPVKFPRVVFPLGLSENIFSAFLSSAWFLLQDSVFHS